MSSVLGLRVNIRTAKASGPAGALPFDKVYFVKREEEHLIPRMLPVCMRLKLTAHTAKVLSGLRCNFLQQEGGGATADAGRVSLDKEVLPESMPTAKELQRDLLAGGAALEKWWMVVPILLSTAKCNPDLEVPHNSKLLYLRNKSWQAPKGKLITTVAIPDSSALIVYGEEITPPCMACPRMMEHIAGQCVLGESTCLGNMGLVHRSQYKKNIAKYRKEVAKDAGILADDADGAGDMGA